MRKFSNLITIVAIAVLTFGCSKTQKPNQNSFLLKGNIQDSDAEYMILSEIGKTGFIASDTIILDKNGNFSHLVKMPEETLYSLSLKDDYITLCPKAKEEIEIKKHVYLLLNKLILFSKTNLYLFLFMHYYFCYNRIH